jgi:2,3-dihydroxyphenylpropionate 1,2-dioxygenase
VRRPRPVEAKLDETGNIELRCWACAVGALGERKPDVVSMDPSWHHNYASLGGAARS